MNKIEYYLDKLNNLYRNILSPYKLMFNHIYNKRKVFLAYFVIFFYFVIKIFLFLFIVFLDCYFLIILLQTFSTMNLFSNELFKESRSQVKLKKIYYLIGYLDENYNLIFNFNFRGFLFFDKPSEFFNIVKQYYRDTNLIVIPITLSLNNSVVNSFDLKNQVLNSTEILVFNLRNIFDYNLILGLPIISFIVENIFGYNLKSLNQDAKKIYANTIQGEYIYRDELIIKYKCHGHYSNINLLLVISIVLFFNILEYYQSKKISLWLYNYKYRDNIKKCLFHLNNQNLIVKILILKPFINVFCSLADGLVEIFGKDSLTSQLVLKLLVPFVSFSIVMFVMTTIPSILSNLKILTKLEQEGYYIFSKQSALLDKTIERSFINNSLFQNYWKNLKQKMFALLFLLNLFCQSSIFSNIIIFDSLKKHFIDYRSMSLTSKTPHLFMFIEMFKYIYIIVLTNSINYIYNKLNNVENNSYKDKLQLYLEETVYNIIEYFIKDLQVKPLGFFSRFYLFLIEQFSFQNI